MTLVRRWAQALRPTHVTHPLGALLFGVRLSAALVAMRRLSGAASTPSPVSAVSDDGRPRRDAEPELPTIDVVVPARDEAERIGPLLDAIVGAPGVSRVIVVDDQSTDGTAAVAAAGGAEVVSGTALPDGWAGKAWALQQGISAADAQWVVTLDADARPAPKLPAALVRRAVGDGYDLLTVGGRFDCPTPGTRWLHASMLTTLVYRFGPPGAALRPDRMMANGQCMTLRRVDFLADGGMEPVAGDVVEDVALARHRGTIGRRVGFLDASDLLTVRMFESIGDTWRGWGRSLALPGIEPRTRQLLDLAVVSIAQALPLPRLLLRRGDVLDGVLLAARLGTLAGTRRAYDRGDVAYWASPLADLASVAAIARGIGRGRAQTWRGRTYS